ncbi:hypothetical protein [Spiribacter insolitus]|uniref:Uncharacterized protein n=1 Tax=Spiribacter insolitus TaxID=3122417 RepID=A0ABV3T9T6_9GAMM
MVLGTGKPRMPQQKKRINVSIDPADGSWPFIDIDDSDAPFLVRTPQIMRAIDFVFGGI